MRAGFEPCIAHRVAGLETALIRDAVTPRPQRFIDPGRLPIYFLCACTAAEDLAVLPLLGYTNLWNAREA